MIFRTSAAETVAASPSRPTPGTIASSYASNAPATSVVGTAPEISAPLLIRQLMGKPGDTLAQWFASNRAYLDHKNRDPQFRSELVAAIAERLREPGRFRIETTERLLTGYPQLEAHRDLVEQALGQRLEEIASAFEALGQSNLTNADLVALFLQHLERTYQPRGGYDGTLAGPLSREVDASLQNRGIRLPDELHRALFGLLDRLPSVLRDELDASLDRLPGLLAAEISGESTRLSELLAAKVQHLSGEHAARAKTLAAELSALLRNTPGRRIVNSQLLGGHHPHEEHP